MPGTGPYSDAQSIGGGGGISTAQYESLLALIQTNITDISDNVADISRNSITQITVVAGEITSDAFTALSETVGTLTTRVDDLSGVVSQNTRTIINVQAAEVTGVEFLDLSRVVAQNTADISQNTADVSANRQTIINVQASEVSSSEFNALSTRVTDLSGVVDQNIIDISNNRQPIVVNVGVPLEPGFYGTIVIENTSSTKSIGYSLSKDLRGGTVISPNTVSTTTVLSTDRVTSFIIQNIEDIGTGFPIQAVIPVNANFTLTRVDNKNILITPVLAEGRINIYVS
tara:strand:+ start:5399 stop:6256 length:858 start_codon:yes stop_codon:yes gene_type:complete